MSSYLWDTTLANHETGSPLPGIIGLCAAVPLTIFGYATYYYIPRRRFADRYKAEYRRPPRIPSFWAGAASSVRLPTWQGVVIWAWLALEGIGILALSLASSIGNMQASRFALNALPVFLFWAAVSGGYAAQDVLWHEGHEQAASSQSKGTVKSEEHTKR